MQDGATARLAEKLRNSHVLTGSWPKASAACSVLTPGGKPNPGLAQMIAEKDYEPKLLATRTRLGLPPICPECHQPLPKPARVVKFDPAQMDTVIAFLRSREKPLQRVYGRGGRPARLGDKA
jgi:hypothetical protein